MSPELLLGILLLDLCLGDPRGWPHPIVWIGRLIAGLEAWLRTELKNLRSAGVILVLLVLAISGLSALAALQLAGAGSGWLAGLMTIWIGWNCLALRSLHKESALVVEALQRGDLNDARQCLSMIVGRETAQLGEEEVLKACIETVAENASDGVIAPLFYLVLGGPVLALLYKASNTMDSMIGYKNDHYRQFGWAAARLDDLLNYIPARLTGLLLVAVSFPLGLNGWAALRIMLRDSGKHSSPNAGWPEAASAGALGIQLGGPASYFGTRIDKPTFGDADQNVTVAHYRQMISLLYASSLLAAALGLLILGVVR